MCVYIHVYIYIYIVAQVAGGIAAGFSYKALNGGKKEIHKIIRKLTKQTEKEMSTTK